MCRLQFHERLEQLVQRGAAHPKMETLVKVLLNHFTTPSSSEGGEGGEMEASVADTAEAGGSASAPGRVIVFTNLRESVSAIAVMLKRHSPVIEPRCVRATYDHKSPPVSTVLVLACSHVCQSSNASGMINTLLKPGGISAGMSSTDDAVPAHDGW